MAGRKEKKKVPVMITLKEEEGLPLNSVSAVQSFGCWLFWVKRYAVAQSPWGNYAAHFKSLGIRELQAQQASKGILPESPRPSTPLESLKTLALPSKIRPLACECLTDR